MSASSSVIMESNLQDKFNQAWSKRDDFCRQFGIRIFELSNQDDKIEIGIKNVADIPALQKYLFDNFDLMPDVLEFHHSPHPLLVQ